jgi:NADH-quinone oxidoreductase subunit M
MVQRVAFGLADSHSTGRLLDLNLREMVTFIPLVVLVFWIGLFPNPVLTAMHASVNNLIEHVDLEEVSLAVPNP